MARLLAAAAIAAFFLGATAPGSASATTTGVGSDDYPFSPQICGHAGSCSGLDPLGFTKQQCVSFVAWRLNQNRSWVSGDFYGDVTNWDAVAQSQGYAVDATPAVGAVAQWKANETSRWTDSAGGTHWMTAGPSGHVAYVIAVSADGLVNIEEYNQSEDQSYHQEMSIRAPRYIHF